MRPAFAAMQNTAFCGDSNFDSREAYQAQLDARGAAGANGTTTHTSAGVVNDVHTVPE
jgi:hypothetical protein